jgi:hypothetical protein
VRQNQQGDGRYLYRGVNADLYKSTGGRLVPKSLGQKFERRAYWGEGYWATVQFMDSQNETP